MGYLPQGEAPPTSTERIKKDCFAALLFIPSARFRYSSSTFDRRQISPCKSNLSYERLQKACLLEPNVPPRKSKYKVCTKWLHDSLSLEWGQTDIILFESESPLKVIESKKKKQVFDSKRSARREVSKI